ncbi:pentatricopeptide repeat (PPR-like) superfamily protein [Artemisia annua]|uniref:Pentatricopeptide repeat (PPR-like) superfamily protein n=1 Tax=Artemisia annua TaxID=35608 RepID=A0A2U1PW83_ARTAN|nr:pentatricopeptide repeat (PPR-like) superfamily protein [Artemisia annua]
MKQLKQIQTQIYALGLAQNVDAIKKIMAFSADPLLGNLSYAQRVFNTIETRNLFVYNVMIKGYVKKQVFQKGVFLFEEMRVFDGIKPDNYTYPFVFKAIGGLMDGKMGRKVHGFVLKCGDVFDCYVCNSVMDMYGELGRSEDARRVFDEMGERDLVSWNVLISAYVKYLELGQEIHGYVRDEIGCTMIIGNALLDMYCKCGCLDVAREIFDGLPKKNVICWTSMVSGYVSCGKLDEARFLFDESPVKDIVLWTAMINGYVQFNHVEEAMRLFQQMQKFKIKPDKFTVVALLTGCAQVGALEQGTWIHEYMNEHRITIDAVCGTALIDMYAKCGCIDKSLEVFYGLHGKDTASWTSIICALSVNGKTSKALQLFTEMKESGFRPDDITFIGVLNACSHGGLVEEGWKHFESIKSVCRIEPKIEHYGCLIDLLGRAGLLKEAENIVNRIPKEKDDILVPVYGALLSACRLYGDVDMGEHLADRLMKIEVGDSSIHTLLANIYASVGRWEDVKKVRSKMRVSGVRKEPGCSSIEVNGDIHEFLVGDASHPELKDVYCSLNTLAKLSSISEIYDVDVDSIVSINS